MHTFSEATTFRQLKQLFRSTGKLVRGKSNWHYLATILLSCKFLYWTDSWHLAGTVGNVLYCSHSVTPAMSHAAEFWGICSPFTNDCGMKSNTTTLYIKLLIRYSRFENSSSSSLSLSRSIFPCLSFWNSVKFLALLEQGCHNTPRIWYHLFCSFNGYFSSRRCMENSLCLWSWWVEPRDTVMYKTLFHQKTTSAFLLSLNMYNINSKSLFHTDRIWQILAPYAIHQRKK